MRDVLAAAGEVEVLHHVPDSGWISMPLVQGGDVGRGLMILKLAYCLCKGRGRAS